MKPEHIQEQLRKEIKECGISLNQLSRLADVDLAGVSRFVSGQKPIGWKNMCRLLNVFDYEIIKKEKAE